MSSITNTSPRCPAPSRPRGGFVALAVLCLAELVGVMDNTIINVGIPTLGRAFSASTTQLQWIVDAYTLVFAVLMLPGDRRLRQEQQGLTARPKIARLEAASLGARPFWRAIFFGQNYLILIYFTLTHSSPSSSARLARRLR